MAILFLAYARLHQVKLKARSRTQLVTAEPKEKATVYLNSTLVPLYFRSRFYESSATKRGENPKLSSIAIAALKRQVQVPNITTRCAQRTVASDF